MVNTVVLAGEWGIHLKDWILEQAAAIGLAAVAIIIIPLIMKRMWAGLIGTLLTSAIALFFINRPQTLENIGTILYDIVFK